MAFCEMCGKQGTTKADVEGVELITCKDCSKYGIIKKSFREPIKKSFTKRFDKVSPKNNNEIRKKNSFKLIDSFSSILQKSRQEKGLKQEDFAKFLNERESLVSKWEQGSITPNIEVAKKLERKLGLKLIEKEEEKKEDKDSFKNRLNKEFTLGDFIKVRKRR